MQLFQAVGVCTPQLPTKKSQVEWGRQMNEPGHISNMSCRQRSSITLPETNIAPENRPLERKFLLETTIFTAYVSFRECNYNLPCINSSHSLDRRLFRCSKLLLTSPALVGFEVLAHAEWSIAIFEPLRLIALVISSEMVSDHV